MTATVNPELDALDAGLTSEFWRLLCEHIEQEWGAVGFAAKLSRTLGDPDLNPTLALAQLQQATVAQKAVLSVRDWPKQRIAQLKRGAITEAQTLSRRGPGL